MSIYQEHIMDHYSNPRNNGVIENPDIYFRDTNPLCGDEIAMYAKVNDDRIERAGFQARGCAISQASASILTESIIGKALAHVYNMSSDEMLELLMIPISPARIKCAVLAMKTLQAGILVRAR